MGEPGTGAVGRNALIDLNGELPSGGQDEGARPRPAAGIALRAVARVRLRRIAAAGPVGVALRTARGQGVDERQGEGSGLAGARLGGGNYIASLQKHGNCPTLNGRRLLVAFGSNGSEYGIAQPELGK